MIVSITKRILAWMLSFLMSFTSAPIQENNLDFDFDLGGIISSLFGDDKENSMWNIILESNTVLLRYFGTNNISNDEIADLFSKMGVDTIESAKEDIKGIKALFKQLSKADRVSFSDTNSARSLSFFGSLLGIDTGIDAYSVSEPQATATILGGKVLITDSQGTCSVSGTTATITVKPSLVSAKSNTIDIYNNTDKDITITRGEKEEKYLIKDNKKYSVVDEKLKEIDKVPYEDTEIYLKGVNKLKDIEQVGDETISDKTYNKNG